MLVRAVKSVEQRCASQPRKNLHSYLLGQRSHFPISMLHPTHAQFRLMTRFELPVLIPVLLPLPTPLSYLVRVAAASFHCLVALCLPPLQTGTLSYLARVAAASLQYLTAPRLPLRPVPSPSPGWTPLLPCDGRYREPPLPDFPLPSPSPCAFPFARSEPAPTLRESLL